MKFASVLSIFCFFIYSFSAIAQETSDGQNVGMISFFASLNGVPDGWLECDGKAYIRSEYQELFEEIGETFGVGDPAEKTFRVPDLSGRAMIGAKNEELKIGDEIGAPKSKVEFTTGDSDDQKTFFSSSVPSSTNPDSFVHTPKHSHEAEVTVSHMQPSLVLRCGIKAK